MALSVIFVTHFGLAVKGVGLAALVSEYAALAFGLVLVARRLRLLGQGFQYAGIFDVAAFRRIVGANADNKIRTFLLIFAFGWFISRGARMGDDVVAANTILLHFFEVAAYMTDGFAYAAEALVGQAIGARQRPRYREAVSLSSFWALAFGAFSGIVIYFAGEQLVRLMTNNEDVVALALTYLPWAAVTPFLGAACFLYDGIFTGALATRDMRNMMIVSTAIFLAVWWLAEPQLGNHGLWLALSVFFVARGVTFAARLPSIERQVFAARPNN
jgi:MATE family multidrug resistance protein